jgi:CheY-like chemotaxis protein
MKSKKVLLVEDNELLRTMYQTKLSRSGLEVFVAKDGGEAISFLKDHIVTIILLDIMMPDINGVEVLKSIRLDKNNINHKSKVFVLSNLNNQALMDEIVSLGIQEFITKADMTPSQVLERIAPHFA